MKFATCRHDDEVHLAVVQGDSILFPAACPGWSPEINSMLQVIDHSDAVPATTARVGVQQSGREQWMDLASVELLSPIPKTTSKHDVPWLELHGPCGGNHTQNGGSPEVAQIPHRLYQGRLLHERTLFRHPGGRRSFRQDGLGKWNWASLSDKAVRGYAGEHALQHVFGYTVINDVSARDLQKRHKQFFIGKSLNGACPMGPWIVTADEVPDPQALNLACRVNGVVKQDSNTRYQIFDIATVIETLSRSMVLEPGDIIATGTPSGVGYVRSPPSTCFRGM